MLFEPGVFLFQLGEPLGPLGRYSEAVKADVRTRMSPPQRQSVSQISAEQGIPMVALYQDLHQ